MTTKQDLNLQKLYILGTGSAANATEMTTFNGMVSPTGGFAAIDTAVDAYINQTVARQGAVATIQALAKNGFGVTLTSAQAQLHITELTAAGINSGSKLINHLSTLQGTNGDTLDNRAQAASTFLDTLSAAGKSANFTGAGVSSAVATLLQNIGSSSASLANGTSGFNALSANLSASGITGTVDDYLSGATVFADTNRDGLLSTGEWKSTTSANGTFEVPNNAGSGKIIAYSGTDLLTGNAFKGLLSATTGATTLNPITTMIEAMVTTGQAGTVQNATSALKGTFDLSADINLQSFNSLAVLASGTSSAAEKATALKVQIASQQISNIITQIASVIDIATTGATLQSAAAAVSIAIAQAITTAAASSGGTINLANPSTLVSIIQAAFTATGTVFTSTQVAQIAQVTAGSNTAAAAAANITMLAQAADVAQGSATNALIAGSSSGNFNTSVNEFTGSALNTANYNVTVGSIAPGVPTPPTASQSATADALAAAAAAAAALALEAPTASLVYSTNGGVTSATTALVNDANTLRITATFSKAVSDGTPTISINNGILVSTAMTKIDSTHYFFDLNVPVGDIATATVTIGGAHDVSSNTISAAPTNAVFAIDNTAPTAPTAVSLTTVGGTILANALNASNTNMTATASITAGQATGGTAVLKVGATTIATDSTILAGDTAATFDLGSATTVALQAAVTAGGVVTVTVTDTAGNSTASAVANPTLIVDYTPPTAPTALALTPTGGTVVANALNATNTNLTATAAITAGQATGGSAVLKVGATTIGTDSTILAGDTEATFTLGVATTVALQAAVAAGGVATVTVTDTAGNSAVSAVANPTLAVDYTPPSAPTALALTAVGGTVVANTLNTTNTNMTATATITAGEATGGSAVLKIGATTIATDSTILAGDTAATFSLGLATNAALKAAVAAGGLATVTVTDAVGNSTVSAVANPTLIVDYTAPAAPTALTLTTIGGTVVPNELNSTNTNLTAVATITAGQATGGSAVLKVGATTIATDATILVGDTSVTFDIGSATNAALKAAVAAGGVATVTVSDTAGNATVSTLSNPTLAVDYLGALIDLTTANDSLNGSTGNDTFTGTFGNGAGPYTFNTGDILNGLAGTADKLNITTGAEASTPPDNLWIGKTNFEKVVFNSTGNGAQVITTGANFEAAFATNGVNLTAKTLLGAIDLTMTSFTGAATITTTTTGAGAHTITTGSGVTTVNATGIAAGAQTINGVGLTTVDATVNGAGNQVIGTTLGGNLVTVNATVLAAGNQTIASTSNSNVTIVAAAASGEQTITTAGGNDNVTTTGAAGQVATISTGSGNDVISAGLSTDLITGGTGADTMTGGGAVDRFQLNADGSVIGTAMDIITDFNTAGADVLSFGAGTAVLLTVDATALVAGVNVNTSAGGLISFHISDNTLAAKTTAVQADVQLDAAGSVAMFVDGGNTYVYYAGAAAGNVDDQLIQLTGITSLTAMTGGATLVIS